jgi:hypothetical protein
MIGPQAVDRNEDDVGPRLLVTATGYQSGSPEDP